MIRFIISFLFGCLFLLGISIPLFLFMYLVFTFPVVCCSVAAVIIITAIGEGLAT